MTDLTRQTFIDPLALRQRDYFATLLAEAQRCGLLSDRDLSRLQGESLALLAERADAWSRGQSTSLPAERAQHLLESVLYTVSLELKAGSSPEEAVERLRNESLAALYEAGQHRIARRLQALRASHRQLKKALFPTANEFYRATLSDGIDGFFKLYRPAFAAQEIHITADYPTFFGLPEKDGVEFMEDYLRCLSHENRFLGCFAPETVHALLLGLDERYPQLILNLYGPVLAAALGCVLTRQSVAALGCVLTRQSVAALRCDLPRLNALLAGKSRQETEKLLRQAAEVFIRGAGCPEGLAAYLRRSVPPLAGEMARAVALGHPEAAVPVPAEW